jgi:hypothetical protein
MGQKIGDARRDMRHMAAFDPQLIIAERRRVARLVLHPKQRRVVSSRAQGVDEVLTVVVEREATMRQPDHPRAMWRLTGEQRGAAWRAGRRGAERLPEEHALLCQSLEMRGRDGVAVGLNIAPGIVRM